MAGIDPGLLGQSIDLGELGSLWLAGTAFPPVHRGKGDTEPLGQLGLGEIERSADGLKER